MKNVIIGAVSAAILLIGATALSRPAAHADALNATRACIPASGHATILDVADSAATSALSTFKVYSVVCTTDVFWEMGDASAATADSNSNYLPQKALMYFSTGGSASSNYFSAVETVDADTGDCYVTQCM